jgi:hypothetical protein
MNSSLLKGLLKVAPLAVTTISLMLLAHGLHPITHGDPGGIGQPDMKMTVSGDPGGIGQPDLRAVVE